MRSSLKAVSGLQSTHHSPDLIQYHFDVAGLDITIGRPKPLFWAGTFDLILTCKKEKNIRSTNFQSNRYNNDEVNMNSKDYREHRLLFMFWETIPCIRAGKSAIKAPQTSKMGSSQKGSSYVPDWVQNASLLVDTTISPQISP